MGLKDKWAEARERERQEREAAKAQQRRYDKAWQLHRMGVPAVTAGGWPDPALSEEEIDARLVAEKQRQAEMYQALVRAGTVTKFPAFGVQILAGDDKVYTIGDYDQMAKTNNSKLLGPLPRAEAKVTDSTSSFSWGKAMTMPIATAPLARKETADALITFPDGTVHTKGLDGSYAVREARKQCEQFNALAGAPAPTSSEAEIEPGSRLRRLQELRAAGLLSEEEYEAKRAEIIASI